MAVISISCVKGKQSMEVDTEKLPQHVYEAALKEGLKVMLNRGTSKITKASTKDEAELKSLAVAQAEKQLAAMYDIPDYRRVIGTAGRARNRAGNSRRRALIPLTTEIRDIPLVRRRRAHRTRGPRPDI